MELKGKRIAILIEDMYNEFEFWYPYYRMKEAGAKYADQEVVRDGNLITSRTPDDLPAFCREIIAALK